MTKGRDWTEVSVAGFADALAAREPLPGSGSGMATVGALGAALASMALRSGRDEASPAVLELERLRRRLLAAITADAEAYARFRTARDGAAELAVALADSIEVPRGVAEDCRAALEQLHAAHGEVRARLVAEAACAARTLLAACEGASFTALTNLVHLPPGPARTRARAELADLGTRARAAAGALEALFPPPHSA